jgi:SAM-dependent methyltransferase
MGRLAKQNLRHFLGVTTHPPISQSSTNAYTKSNLTRALAQHLPFSNNSFDSVVATFPAEYIFHANTLQEAHRVLVTGGRFVVLPGATLLGRGILDRVMALIFHITGQSAPNLGEILKERASKPFAEAGFHMQVHELNIKSSLVFILVATKRNSVIAKQSPV